MIDTQRLIVYGLLVFLTGVIVAPSKGKDSIIDDIKVEYSIMNITEAKVGGQTVKPHFYRQYAHLELGKGQTTAGILFQHTSKSKNTSAGIEEDGIMLTAGYDLILSTRLRLQAYGRLGISSDNNPGQPLYATDTDLRLNAVLFNPAGITLIRHKPVFPSLYGGVIVNKYGRTQAIAGSGLWWNKIGIFFTGYHAFNGVADPFNPGRDGGIRFANLQNRGLTAEISYEFRDFKVLVRQNFAIRNSGNHTMLELQYRCFFAGVEQ